MRASLINSEQARLILSSDDSNLTNDNCGELCNNQKVRIILMFIPMIHFFLRTHLLLESVPIMRYFRDIYYNKVSIIDVIVLDIKMYLIIIIHSNSISSVQYFHYNMWAGATLF